MNGITNYLMRSLPEGVPTVTHESEGARLCRNAAHVSDIGPVRSLMIWQCSSQTLTLRAAIRRPSGHTCAPAGKRLPPGHRAGPSHAVRADVAVLTHSCRVSAVDVLDAARFGPQNSAIGEALRLVPADAEFRVPAGGHRDAETRGPGTGVLHLDVPVEPLGVGVDQLDAVGSLDRLRGLGSLRWATAWVAPKTPSEPLSATIAAIPLTNLRMFPPFR